MLSYKRTPDARDKALELIEDGYVSAEDLLTMCLKYMSTDDVADMLDCNELSERFIEEEELIDEFKLTANYITVKIIKNGIIKCYVYPRLNIAKRTELKFPEEYYSLSFSNQVFQEDTVQFNYILGIKWFASFGFLFFRSAALKKSPIAERRPARLFQFFLPCTTKNLNCRILARWQQRANKPGQ